MVTVRNVTFSARTQIWCAVVVITVVMVLKVAALNGPNVCMVKQKYNITKRIKYRAPLSVRRYEWCMSLPPRCSRWTTEMRDLTRLETEERTAEVAVCCPGYKMREVSCVPICPNGRTGHGCSEECPQSKWGPNCVNDCPLCTEHGTCSPITGECSCQGGWQGESCESRMSSTTISSTTTTTSRVEELLTKLPATKPTLPVTSTSSSKATLIEITSSSTIISTSVENASSTTRATNLEISSTKIAKVTTLAPRTTSVQIISNPMTNLLLNNVTSTSSTFLLETTTGKSNRLVPPLTSTLATFENVTTETPAMTPKTRINNSTVTVTLRTEVVPKISHTTINGESTQIISNKEHTTDRTKVTTTTTTESTTYQSSTVYNNITVPTLSTTEVVNPITQIKETLKANSIYNRTEAPHETRKYVNEVHVEIKNTPIRILKSSEISSTAFTQKTTALSVFTEPSTTTTPHVTPLERHIKTETTRRPDATIRYFPTTVKFKPKEIWIRPAQKGESFIETKKINHDLHLRHRVVTNNEPAPSTTPKTIIVSIIPTSVSYATFKKIALTTASLLYESTNQSLKSYHKSTEQGFTKPVSVLTTVSSAFDKNYNTTFVVESTTKSSGDSSKSNPNFNKVAKTLSTLTNTKNAWKNKTVSMNGSNSMTTVDQNLNSFNSITPTVSSTNFISTTHKPTVGTVKDDTRRKERVTKIPIQKSIRAENRNVTVSGKTNDTANITKTVAKNVENTNATRTKNINTKTNKITTESPDDEETFHILTEPEHITAVMEGKENERTSVDLISVISIVGGIMMAVITVAVIVVMIERCRRPRYEDVRKVNDIHMQVMIDNNDVPPPYVRSIFHTPLPDPPTSEKCHYQPLSTLDRNLKQFMRPVVVQTISPIMLENFRGILECHYDHLPRRRHDFEVREKHCSVTPSVDNMDELTHLRLRPCSIAESTIDALKCEARLDVLDSSTSEPLYAEIPCWRPPSEHAVEIINLNGEAVTEL